MRKRSVCSVFLGSIAAYAVLHAIWKGVISFVELYTLQKLAKARKNLLLVTLYMLSSHTLKKNAAVVAILGFLVYCKITDVNGEALFAIDGTSLLLCVASTRFKRIYRLFNIYAPNCLILDCPVCLHNRYVKLGRRQSCQHALCCSCTRKWYKDNASCPVCRSVVLPLIDFRISRYVS